MKNLTPHQSHYVLSTLLGQGKVRVSQVEKALRGRVEEIRSLRERLASLEGLFAKDGPFPMRRARRRRGRQAAAAPRRRKMSRRVRALRRLQGKYMGFVRRLNAAEKARVRSVREKQGIGPSIRLASFLARKS